MSEIDWSKCPQATHFAPKPEDEDMWNGVFWRIVDGEGVEAWAIEGGRVLYYSRPTWRAETAVRLIARPVQWSGEGLPPVGTVCELWPKPSVEKTAVDHDRYKSLIGLEVKIIAHHDIGDCIAAVFVGSNDFVFEYHSMVEGNFRPVRTAEQIAAEERTKAIDDLVKVTCINRGEAACIYDAGYRKQVTP